MMNKLQIASIPVEEEAPGASSMPKKNTVYSDPRE
jgi:hypothetical protein